MQVSSVPTSSKGWYPGSMGEISAPLPSLAAQIQCLVEEKYGGKQAALALVVGVSEATVHRWSTGFIESPHEPFEGELGLA